MIGNGRPLHHPPFRRSRPLRQAVLGGLAVSRTCCCPSTAGGSPGLTAGPTQLLWAANRRTAFVLAHTAQIWRATCRASWLPRAVVDLEEARRRPQDALRPYREPWAAPIPWISARAAELTVACAFGTARRPSAACARGGLAACAAPTAAPSAAPLALVRGSPTAAVPASPPTTRGRRSSFLLVGGYQLGGRGSMSDDPSSGAWSTRRWAGVWGRQPLPRRQCRAADGRGGQPDAHRRRLGHPLGGAPRRRRAAPPWRRGPPRASCPPSWSRRCRAGGRVAREPAPAPPCSQLALRLPPPAAVLSPPVDRAVHTATSIARVLTSSSSSAGPQGGPLACNYPHLSTSDQGLAGFPARSCPSVLSRWKASTSSDLIGLKHRSKP